MKAKCRWVRIMTLVRGIGLLLAETCVRALTSVEMGLGRTMRTGAGRGCRVAGA